jgi:hypothetical protein
VVQCAEHGAGGQIPTRPDQIVNIRLPLVVAVLTIVVALTLLVGVSMTGAATRASGVTQQTTVQFKRLNDIAADAVGVRVCFSGDFPKKVDIYGQAKWDLPVTLVVTAKDVRRKNEISGTSTRQPRSQRAYKYNPKDYGWAKLIRGPAFYVIYPTSISAQSCSEVQLDEKGAKASFGKYVTTTGKFRLRVASSGQFLGESSWAWQIESFGASVIWEGTDNFINICINHSYELRSQGGRLYCVQKAGTFYKITQLS